MQPIYSERISRFVLALLAAGLLLFALARFGSLLPAPGGWVPGEAVPGASVTGGLSWRTNEPVAELVGVSFRSTLTTLAKGVGLALPLALLLGIPAGLKPQSWLDRLLQGPAVALAGVPAFTTGLLGLMYLVTSGRVASMEVATLAVLAVLLAAWMARAVRNGLASLAADGARPPAGRAAVAVAGRILQQTGNILVVTMLLQWVGGFGGGGIWRQVVNAVMTRDLPVVYGALWPILLLAAAGHLLGDVLVTAAQGSEANPSPWPRLSATWLIIGGLLACALVLPLLLGRGDPMALNLADRLQPPGPEHPLGADPYGRDLLARLGQGARTSVTIAAAGTFVAGVGGVLLALVASLFGNGGRALLTPRIAVPGLLGPLVVGLLVILLRGPSVYGLILALGVASIPAMAQAFRLLFDSRVTPPAKGYAALGAVVLTFAQILFVESLLSFGGFGVQPPIASLGNLLNEASTYLRSHPHLFWGAAPGAFGLAGLFLVGHGLKEAATE